MTKQIQKLRHARERPVIMLTVTIYMLARLIRELKIMEKHTSDDNDRPSRFYTKS